MKLKKANTTTGGKNNDKRNELVYLYIDIAKENNKIQVLKKYWSLFHVNMISVARYCFILYISLER